MDGNGLQRCLNDGCVVKKQIKCIFLPRCKTEIKCIIDKRVPTKMMKPKHTHPWMNTDIRRKINQKHRAHAKARKRKKTRIGSFSIVVVKGQYKKNQRTYYLFRSE
jgi:hypothetical protein